MKQTSNSSARAWQRMLSGRRLDLLDPTPLDVELEDIAHGLARVARWNGQTSGDNAFSVAQHSLIVEQLLGVQGNSTRRDEMLYALLHDAPEYVIGDMISPFKAVLGHEYKDVEIRLEAAVHLRVGLPPHPTVKLKQRIKSADRLAAYFEAITLAGFEVDEAARLFGRPNGVTVDQLDLQPWPAVKAELAFLERLHAVMEMA